MKKGQNVYVDGKKVTIVEVKGNWVTILDDGNERKVRSGAVKLSLEEKAPSSVLKPAAKADTKKPAPAKAEKVKAEKKGARPAGEGKVEGGIIHADLSRYTRGAAQTASGNDTLDIGDPVAIAMRGMQVDKLYEFAARHLIAMGAAIQKVKKGEIAPKPTIKGVVEFLSEKYRNLNAGQQRMNLGNRLRAAYKAYTAEHGKYAF